MSHTEMEQAEAISFLESLLGKTLHITILDGRLFTGIFKCTDNESNVILANSFEYRMPSKAAEEKAKQEAKVTGRPARADMTSRFVGLIVVPGKQIVKMELEESRMYAATTTASASVSTPALTIRTKG
ncbi:hypothetical protein H2198_002320 [Neophaeococcomyces mojaviensis]|uniref:Uncharacterized protein n=1 Tax=Neophaeococcomyces mojaviensis TaxID=3383035 RepID=A0ACC3AEE1_9EURO|nr:hypothetical protein H2198_002320 [Knufia sp. JES_112]